MRGHIVRSHYLRYNASHVKDVLVECLTVLIFPDIHTVHIS